MTKQIAASVAEALGLTIETRLGHAMYVSGLSDADGRGLYADGSNVFNDYWFRWCLEWLLKNGHGVHFYADDDIGQIVTASGTDIHLQCPAIEFPARAIHELMKVKES
jgi:hypothetical protein